MVAGTEVRSNQDCQGSECVDSHSHKSLLAHTTQQIKLSFSNNYFLFCFYYTKVTLSIHLDSHVILKEMCFNTKIAFNLFIYNVFIC